MNCPNCGLEMEHGNASFLPMQGMDMMSMTYVSDGESQKGRFHRRTHSVILSIGLAAEAYHCASCRLILPVMRE